MLKVKNKRLEDIIIKMLSDNQLGYHYFGEFLLHVNFIENNSIPTAGVNVTKRGMNFYYNDKFINGLTELELGFIVIHEILHLQYKHQFRREDRDPQTSNVAMDMIINHIIEKEMNKNFSGFGNLKPVILPTKYKGKLVYEDVYDWLVDNPEENPFNGEGGDGEGNGGIVDVHFDSEVSEEYAKTIINDVIQGIKARGIEPGGAEGFLGKIEPPKKDYIKILKRSLSYVRGSQKMRTYSRRSRRDVTGLKGNKRVGIEINVLLDTSGSMSGEFEKVLSTIYQNGIVSNIIQVDTKVNEVLKVSCKKDIEKIKIKGYGGTELQPGIEFLKTRKDLLPLPTLVLTDGYCDSLNFDSLMNRVLVITTGVDVNINGSKRVKQINLNESI